MIRNGNRIIRSCIVSMVFFAVLLTAWSAHAIRRELDHVRHEIKARGARWHAEETSVSLLNQKEKKNRLGQHEHEGLAADVLDLPEMFYAPMGDTMPAALDWRNESGVSYVTPVKNQGSCGSCWAFAVTAALESQVMLSTGGQPLDLSEQILVSCSGAGSCSGGSSATASNYVRDMGLPLESCFRYTATDNACSNACLDWQNSTYKVIGWHRANASTTTIDDIKKALYSYGPVVATMYVYNDFYYYRSGVYSYTTGSYVGAHAVLVTGYDDTNQSFIVKNSWGTGWGESGYFMIAYAEVTGTSRFGYSVLAYDGYGTVACVQANPTMTLSPSATQTVAPGTPASYTVSVTNRDGSGCAGSTFGLSTVVPGGWTASMSSPTLTINPGATASTMLSVTPSSAASDGPYAVTVNATDGGYTTTANVTVNIQAPIAQTCVKANPTVALSPTVVKWVKAGTTVPFTLSITNNDTSACVGTTFDMGAEAPNGWAATLSNPALTLAPGGSTTTTLNVTSPAAAPDGTYIITARSKKNTESNWAVQTSATETLVSSLATSIGTDKSTYKPNQQVLIKATVSASGSAVPNATVTFIVTKDGSVLATKTVATDSSGNASFTWAQKTKPAGTYSATINASYNGVLGSNTATFKVQ